MYHSKKWIVTIIVLFVLLGAGVILRQSIFNNQKRNLLTVTITTGAVNIFSSQSDKIYYVCDEKIFTVSQSISKNNNLTLMIKSEKKNNWTPEEIMKLYVPENLYSKLVLNTSGIVSMKELAMDYLVFNSGGLQMSLPNNYTGNIDYTGDSNSFLEIESGKNTSNYTCEVQSADDAFISLPFPDFDSFQIPKKYKYRAGTGEHNWTFRVEKNATFAMEFR